jgi:flavin-dependent dehydrogenase
VGAFGVNSNLVTVFEDLGFGYRAPRTARARQAEILLDPQFIQEKLRNRVLIFAMGQPGLRFAAVTPKRQHATVTLIGDNPDRTMLEQVLRSPDLKAHFPKGWEMPGRYCSCAPKMPVSAAYSPVSDRLLMIGDTNVSRYLKNGIESAFYTAMWAAHAICAGMSSQVSPVPSVPASWPPFGRETFRRRYVSVCHRTYLRDNRFGRFLFRLHDFISRSSVTARAHLLVAQQEQRGGGVKPLSEILWGLFTGSVPYRAILWKALSPRLQLRLLRAIVAAAAQIWPTGNIPSETKASPALPSAACRPEAGRLGPVRRDQTIIIVGAGPAGTSCAISLARLGKLQGIAPQIILIEGKRFGEHQNQDAGVLSPPGPELLAELLGESPPANLFQRKIQGYVLHGNNSQVHLDGGELGEYSFALRRVELDSLLLDRARASGAEIVMARATAVEVDQEGVVVYTEGSSFHGDALVGAFALDEGMARALSHRTRYRPPAALETLACKIHPAGLDFIPGLLGDCIHVFLPKQAGVEFGALVPKGNHVTVVIAGARLSASDMARFLAQDQVAELIPAGSHVRGYYKGAFPLGPARDLCGDRHVMIGDAAGLVRPFKGKGINCALESGQRCAQTMLSNGISQAALALVERGQRDLTRDVWFGRVVRLLVRLIERFELLDPIIEHAKRSHELCQALFDCISGRTTYRDVVLRRRNLTWLPRVTWQCAVRKVRPHRGRA